MITINKQFKLVIMILVLTFSFSLIAQEKSNTIKTFLRVYSKQGDKINKGRFKFYNDSLLVLERGYKLQQVYIKDIGYIKTKRSAGHNVLVGATSGVAAGVVLGSLNPPTDSSGGTFTWAGDSAGNELAIGITYGILTGTVVGSITAIFKNSETYIIDGKIENLKIFTNSIAIK